MGERPSSLILLDNQAFNIPCLAERRANNTQHCKVDPFRDLRLAVRAMSSSSSDSSDSESEEKKKKDKKKKAKKKEKKKKSDKKKKRDKKKKKDKKKKASSSSSDSSDDKKTKKDKKRKQEEADAKNAWVATRMRELRKADSNLALRDAMKAAEEEYEQIFNNAEAPKKPTEQSAEWGLPAAAEAAKEAEEEARKLGKSEEEIAQAGKEAGEKAMRVAEEAGVYAPPKELPLFMQARLQQQSDAARLAAMPAPTAGENSRPAEMMEPRRLALKLPEDSKDKRKKR